MARETETGQSLETAAQAAAFKGLTGAFDPMMDKSAQV
jgi:hypothetical protein